MTDDEVVEFYEKLVEHFGDNLANFEHYPKQFTHQVKLYRYYMGRKENESSNLQ